MKAYKNIIAICSKVSLVLLLLMLWANPVSAHRSPDVCYGSGLGINLYTNVQQVHIGDEIIYTVEIFNGAGTGPVVCDASNIQASLVTPDNQTHDILLRRTSLLNGEIDSYPNIVTYIARAEDVKADGTLTATASDRGDIHQNDTNSIGGSNQGVNVTVLSTLRVIKLVVNANGGTAVSSDFTIHVKNSGADVTGSPSLGAGAPGTSYSLSSGTYVVSENANTSYAQSFSGDCDSSGSVVITTGTNKLCTVVNTDIPVPAPVVVPTPPVISTPPVIPTPPAVPIVIGGGGGGGGGNSRIVPFIGILKVPTPLALSGGSGPVTYNYTVWNVGGQLALTDVTVADDKCNPVVLVSGDLDNNRKLDIAEKWKFSCTMTLATTTTNTAVATGYGYDAYHQVAIATAIATVIVSSTNASVAPLPPPLINIVKLPSRLTPLPYGGAYVVYSYTVTNPGVVPLSNVAVTDDKCAPISVPFGDTNGNSLLEPSESWVYACVTKVSVSTRNVAMAIGKANGLTALGYAFATVLVSAPGIPNTGFPPGDKNTLMIVVALAGIFMLVAIPVMIFRKRKI